MLIPEAVTHRHLGCNRPSLEPGVTANSCSSSSAPGSHAGQQFHAFRKRLDAGAIRKNEANFVGCEWAHVAQSALIIEGGLGRFWRSMP